MPGLKFVLTSRLLFMKSVCLLVVIFRSFVFVSCVKTTVHTPTVHTHVWYQTTVHTPTIHTHVWYCTKHRTYLAEKKIIIFRDTPSHWQHKSTKLLLSTIWYMTSRCYPRALLFARFNLWAALVTFLESFGGNHRNQTDRMHPVDRQFDMPDSDK